MSRDITYILGNPSERDYFIAYPACKDVNILAQFGLVNIVFPSILESESILTVLDCSSSSILFDNTGKPVKGENIVVNKPYHIIFDADFGGYRITNLTIPDELRIRDKDSKLIEHKPKKEDKK